VHQRGVHHALLALVNHGPGGLGGKPGLLVAALLRVAALLLVAALLRVSTLLLLGVATLLLLRVTALLLLLRITLLLLLLGVALLRVPAPLPVARRLSLHGVFSIRPAIPCWAISLFAAVT
jgi:hypothetical protein